MAKVANQGTRRPCGQVGGRAKVVECDEVHRRRAGGTAGTSCEVGT